MDDDDDVRSREHILERPEHLPGLLDEDVRGDDPLPGSVASQRGGEGAPDVDQDRDEASSTGAAHALGELVAIGAGAVDDVRAAGVESLRGHVLGDGLRPCVQGRGVLGVVVGVRGLHYVRVDDVPPDEVTSDDGRLPSSGQALQEDGHRSEAKVLLPADVSERARTVGALQGVEEVDSEVSVSGIEVGHGGLRWGVCGSESDDAKAAQSGQVHQPAVGAELLRDVQAARAAGSLVSFEGGEHAGHSASSGGSVADIGDDCRALDQGAGLVSSALAGLLCDGGPCWPAVDDVARGGGDAALAGALEAAAADVLDDGSRCSLGPLRVDAGAESREEAVDVLAVVLVGVGAARVDPLRGEGVAEVRGFVVVGHVGLRVCGSGDTVPPLSVLEIKSPYPDI